MSSISRRGFYPTKHRKDFTCTDCQRFFSVYYTYSLKPYCPFCGDNLPVQRYSYAKHGTLTGTYVPWTQRQKQKLYDLMQEPLSWAEIAEQMGRSVGSLKRKSSVFGFKRKYDGRKLKKCVGQ